MASSNSKQMLLYYIHNIKIIAKYWKTITNYFLYISRVYNIDLTLK